MTNIEKTNELIWSMGIKFRAEMAHSSGPTPARLPVIQSFTLAATHHFLTCSDVAVRRLLLQTSPEDIGRRERRLGSAVSPLSIWMLGYHFLVGREILLDLQELNTRARSKAIVEVLDYWRRLSFAQRSDGHLDNSDAGSTNLFLPPATLQQLYRALIPVDPEIKDRLRLFLATLEGYLFLLNAEARLGMVDSGPYPLSATQMLIVRDFLDLRGEHYPWGDAATDMPYRGCSLAFTFDPSEFDSIALSDRAMLLTSPAHYIDAVRDIALMCTDGETLQVLPFTEMDWLTRAARKARSKVLDWFAYRSRHEWIVYGALPWIRRSLALLSGEENPLLWNVSPEALRLLPTYEDNEAQALRWATHRCLRPGGSSAFVPIA